MLISHVGEHGSLILEVEEDRLLYEGERVYSYDASRDNLAFILFRDGVRLLSLHPGLLEEEVEALTDCLAHADDLADAEHDLVTRFWEQDFAHIDYHVADPFLGGEVLDEGTVDALRETVLRRLDEVALPDDGEASLKLRDLTAVEPVGIDVTSLGLSAQEIDQSERAAQEPSDLVDDFLAVLLEMAGKTSGTYDEHDPLTRALITVVDGYLDRLNLEGLEVVVEQLQRLEAQGRYPPGFAGLVIGGAVTARKVTGLLAGCSEEAGTARVERFLTGARPWIIPALLEALAATEDRAARKTLLAILDAGGGVSGSHLVPLFEDPRWYVVRNAAQLAAGVRDPKLVGQLERLRRHPDVRVRREIVRTLDAFAADPAALQALARAASDQDSSVRTLAARSLGRHGGREHEAVILAQIEAKDFDSRPPDEIEALLLALADLSKERGVPVLDRLWRRRLFVARPMSVRVAALRALGTISDPSSQTALSQAAKSGEAQIKKTALRALQEARRSGGEKQL
jgi:HEAT repeats